MRTTVNDRPATVMFIDDTFTPVDEEAATLLEVTFDDGARIFIRPPPEGRNERFDPGELRVPKGSPGGGQWTSGGAGTAQGFVSPSVASHLSFAEAAKAVESEPQQQLAEISAYIDQQLGIKDSTHANAVGAWADGAENSMMVEATASPAVMRAAMAMKGHIADQKAVLMFEPDAAGNHFMVSFPAKGKLEKIHERLLKDGLAFHTLEPVKGGATVHVFASDQATVDAIEKAAGKNPVEYTQGHGEFIGTTKETGTDREQRDDARRVYESVIAEAGHSKELEGQDVGKVWQDVRDRWERLSKAEVSDAPIDVAATEAKAKAGVEKAAAADKQPPLPGSKATHPATVATRQPTSKKAATTEYGQPGVDAMHLDEDNYNHDVDLFRDVATYPQFRPGELQACV